MRREEHIDYFLVPDGQIAIHEELTNWARWVRVRPHGWQVSPMFRQYRSKAFQWHAPEIKTPTNIPAAVEMEKAVSLLPEKHRDAIRWHYYWSTVHPAEATANGWAHGPVAMARHLGVSKQGLLDLVNDARWMLRNRGV